MRLVYFGMIFRLLLVLVSPSIALAAETDSQNTLQNTNQNLVKIDGGTMVEFSEPAYTQNETLSYSILKPQTTPLPADKLLSVNEKRVKAFQRFLDAYTPPTGKIDILVTGYSSTVDQCDGDPFTTASGTHVHKGTMACPKAYPFGTKISIEGMGTFVCEDRGGAITGNHFDMWFETRAQALQWGKRIVQAEITK